VKLREQKAISSATPKTVALDGELADGERIDLGGVELEVMHLPGHSLGHLGLFESSTATAIVSDAVMGRGFPDIDGQLVAPPPYIDLAAYRTTIARLRDLAPAVLGTAHFPSLEGARVDEFLVESAEFTVDLERALQAADPPHERPIAGVLGDVASALGGYPQMQVELARSIGATLVD
jgi:glyoxylase-like metal-dependent hydrolase (beta-lactamase superfamily II)